VLAARFDGVSEERLKRFRREAEVVARLEHPNICSIYDADLDGDTPWIAMRFVEGRTLAEILSSARAAAASSTAEPAVAMNATRVSVAVAMNATRAPATEAMNATWPPRSAIDVHRVLHLFERCARALHAAHEAGVVHRDVKPGNIVVAHDGAPVLLDFGLARDEQSDVGELTRSGDVFGTPAYMSPEQLGGASDALDRRTDVYSLGVSLYEALTLERPFEAPTRIALFQAIENRPAPDPRRKNAELSEDVKVVLATALDKDRARRYGTALELAEDLRRIREYEPVRARPAGAALKLARWTQRHPALAISIAGTLIALSCGLALSLVLLSQKETALDGERNAVAKQKEALRSALGRHLAERANALIAEDPSASLALAIDAVERAPNYLTRSALFAALDACYLETYLAGNPRIGDLAISPDGTRAVAGLDDGAVRVFELAKGTELAHHPEARGKIVGVRWSPDGKWIASAAASGELCVRDASSGAVVHEARGDGPWAQIEFDARSSRLLALSSAGRVTIWSTSSWRVASAFDQGDSGITRACFASDGEQVVTIASPAHAKARAATLWDVRTARAVRDLVGHGGEASSGIGGEPEGGGELSWCDACRDPSARLVLVASRDGDVRVFDLAALERAPIVLHHDAPVEFACFSPDGSRVAAATELGDEEGAVHLWDLASRSDRVLSGPGQRKVVHAAFDPSGSRLATASVDLCVRVWSTSDGTQQREMRALFRPESVAWTSDGRRIVSRANGLVALVWSASIHSDVFSIQAHGERINSVAFSPDGALALTASDDGSARVWVAGDDASSGDGVRSLDVPSASRRPGDLVHVLRHAASVRSARFNTDGEEILTISDDGSARLWSTLSGDPVRKMQHPRAVISGELGADGARVLTVCDDGFARIWPTREAPPLVLCNPRGAHATCARFDRRAELVALGADDDVLRIYDARTGDLSRELAFTSEDAKAHGIVDVAFHPGGNEVAAACADNRVRFWSLAPGTAARRNIGLSQPRSLCFSNDGGSLLVLGRRGLGAVRVQDLVTNQNVRQPEIRHAGDITCGSFSRDGRYVLTASKDSTALVWYARTGQPSVQRAGRGSPITCAEFSTDSAEPRVITGSLDGTLSIWPVDPLPAALKRKPRELYDWERAREERLASPLVYE
jgi:WD40 repeat protein